MKANEMICNKSEFLKSLKKEELDNGAIRVLIECRDGIPENVWAYQDDNMDKSFAILLNTPLSYFPVLYYGSEVKIKYRDNVAILDTNWVVEECNRYVIKRSDI